MLLTFPEAVSAAMAGSFVLAYDPRDRNNRAQLTVTNTGQLCLDGSVITAGQVFWLFEEEGPARLRLTEVIQQLSSGKSGAIFTASDVFGTYSAYVNNRDDDSTYITIATPRGCGAPSEGWQSSRAPGG